MSLPVDSSPTYSTYRYNAHLHMCGRELGYIVQEYEYSTDSLMRFDEKGYCTSVFSFIFYQLTENVYIRSKQQSEIWNMFFITDSCEIVRESFLHFD